MTSERRFGKYNNVSFIFEVMLITNKDNRIIAANNRVKTKMRNMIDEQLINIDDVPNFILKNLGYIKTDKEVERLDALDEYHDRQFEGLDIPLMDIYRDY